MRVFLDTNVIFSGLYSAGGTPGAILQAFIEGRIGVVISRQVLEELVQTVKEKLPSALADLNHFLTNLPLEVTEDPPPELLASWESSFDPADGAILAAAILAEPDYFVSGDSDFIKNKRIVEKSGLKLATPAELLKLLA